MTEDVEYKSVPLQQGVSVKVVELSLMREAWNNFKRDDYEDDMDRVAGKVGSILHQHPSGAFTVIFEGKAGGLKKGEKLRLKFPPRALTSCDVVPVKKRRPRLPKHVKTKKAPASPVSSTPAPTAPLVEPEIVNEPPPESTTNQKRIDECLVPSPKLADPVAREKSIEAERLLAIYEEEEDYIKEEDVKRDVEPAEPASEEDDAEAAFLDDLEEEEAAAAAEEEAFLDDLDDSSAAPSPPPSSVGSPQQPDPQEENIAPTDDGPRVQVIYEPHNPVTENTKRFGGAALRSKQSNVDDSNVIKQKTFCTSPRRQVLAGDSLKVGDLRARFDQ